MIRKILLCVALIISGVGAFAFSVPGQLRLTDRHPGEPADYTFNQRFSPRHAVENLRQIEAFLRSFRPLTERCETRLPAGEVKSVGNTERDVQDLGFYNAVKSVEGTVRKQEYLIRRLEYELAKAKYAAGEVGKTGLERKWAAYRSAEKEFQAFWSSYRVPD